MAPERLEELEEEDLELMAGDDLQEKSPEDLGELFSTLEVPEREDFSGKFKAFWLAGPLEGKIGFLQKVRAAVAGSQAFPWKGMDFDLEKDSADGTNLLLGMDGGLKLFDFSMEVEESVFDGEDCMAFDYDAGDNIPPFRLLRDEVRKVNNDLFLGRGNIRLGGKCRFIAWFALERD